MIWKTLFLTIMAVGVLAEYKLTDEQRDKVKEVLREQCKKVGAEDKVDTVQNSITTFVDCAKNLIDLEVLKKEIEDAKPKGELDEVFKKYCAKSPQMKTCIQAVLDGVTPCLDNNVRVQVGEMNNATNNLLDFVCYKDGDRIALFIAEGGPECFQTKLNKLRDCAMKVKDDVATVENAETLTLEEKCAKFDEVSTCVVQALEECSTPTPGNMAESVLKYVRNGTPCPKKP